MARSSSAVNLDQLRSTSSESGSSPTIFRSTLNIYVSDPDVRAGHQEPKRPSVRFAAARAEPDADADDMEIPDPSAIGNGSVRGIEIVREKPQLTSGFIDRSKRRTLQKYNPLPDNPTTSQRFCHAWSCPPHGPVAVLLTKMLICLLVWLTCLSLLRDDALPSGNLFALIMLVICALICGFLVSLVRLPPLLGMLIAGFLLRNVPGVNVAQDINVKWSSVLRNIALTVILTRAGLGLDARALRKLSRSVILLAFIPCLCEAAAVGVSAYLIMGFPWLWGFLLGFVQAAVSPAVLVPFMLNLQETKLGTRKGIPTLLMAASSLDDVLAISGFSVLLSLIFSTDVSLWFQVLKGPLELFIGLMFGIFIGVVFWYLPHRQHDDVSILRFLFLFCGGLVAVFGSKAVGFSGAGALGCLTGAFVAAHKWRTPGWDVERVKTQTVFAYLWTFFQPLLFGLIGAEVVLAKVRLETVGLAVAVLICGLIVRMLATVIAVTGSGLNMKERLFTAIAWIPKATVQAALGSLALDAAREQSGNSEAIILGEKVVTIAALLILITAPLGAIGISLTAKSLLQYESVEMEELSASEKHGDVEQNGIMLPHRSQRNTLKMIDDPDSD